jgi:hypothetical protein
MRIASTCHERHRRHQHHEADHRSLDHDLPAVAIAQPAPGWRKQRGQARRDAEADAGPDRDRSDVGDAELGDEQGEERHHQREPGEAEEARGRHGSDVAPPSTLG